MESEEVLLSKLGSYFAACPFPVTLAYLFGSQASGQTTSLSDVDVAVSFVAEDGEEFYLALLSDLKRLLQREEVDLIYMHKASPLLRQRIVRDGSLLYARSEQEQVREEARIFSEYFDYMDFHAVQSRYLHQRISQRRMGEGSRDMIDRQVVEERLHYIDEMLKHLKAYATLTLGEFKADREKSHAALYELQTCLEAITDIGNHLVAALNLRKPEERGELMTILGEAGIVPFELAVSLRRALGLRKVIVHGYLSIALDLVHRALQEDLGDIEEFCQHVDEIF